MLDNFLFGAATSAYQIEGAWDEDGKAPSIWDEYSHRKGYVKNGHTGDIACDHYHKWKEDIKLMKELGINAYRFSISWSRICTKKDMCTNLKGIEFYRNLVKALKDAGIEPFATLYHWDLPKWLDDMGGWANPKSIDYFKSYAETMFKALPEVNYWITINEPAVFINNWWGHNNLAKAIKNVLLAHGKSIQHVDGDKAKVGISLNLIPIVPADVDDPEDSYAADNCDKRHNKVWLEPIFNGVFPEDIDYLLFEFKKGTLKLSKDEAEIVSTPIDFLGINYYTAEIVKHDKANPPTYARHVTDVSVPQDEMRTERHPDGLYILLKELKKQYGNNETYITENGCAYSDVITHDGEIHDYDRMQYIKQHLYFCDKAIKDGINLKGYFYWSLTDNFEWTQGYNKRFGLAYIDYPSLKRIPKDSFKWYSRFIKDEEFRKEELGSGI